MGMVWDYAMLCYKAIYAFNQYAINRFRQYQVFLRCFGTRFRSLESKKIIIGSLQVHTLYLTFSLK